MKSCGKVIASVVFLLQLFSAVPALCQQGSREKIADQIKKREGDLVDYRKTESWLKHFLDPEEKFLFLNDNDSFIPVPLEDQWKLKEDIKMLMVLNHHPAASISKEALDAAVEKLFDTIMFEHGEIKRKLENDLGAIRENIRAVTQDLERLKSTMEAGPIHDISGTWIKVQPDNQVMTIKGGPGSYEVTVTDKNTVKVGYFENGGLLKGDGTNFEGSVRDKPGTRYKNEGYMWIKVIDKDTFQSRSVWWPPGQGSKEKPRWSYQWQPWKRVK